MRTGKVLVMIHSDQLYDYSRPFQCDQEHFQIWFHLFFLKIDSNHINSDWEQQPCNTASPELVAQSLDGERAAL